MKTELQFIYAGAERRIDSLFSKSCKEDDYKAKE